MAEADDCVVWIQAHDWQTALSRLELRHHLSDADVQPTQESTLALLKKNSLMKLFIHLFPADAF